ncbi:hypothetical protein [Gulosibacter bifidus]|uniref:Lipoprotein n=1 Tax=Gulosibacter bifidus TaxID=272239 RepID=A0ABW5RJ35_9MICO|nr:hypothetical protein [Gulosibacter bifidus]
MKFKLTSVSARRSRAINRYVLTIACVVALTGCAPSNGNTDSNTSQSIDTIEEAKAESLRLQRELVDLSEDLRKAPQVSQPEPIGERERTLLNCDSNNKYYQYPGITSVVFMDADSVVELHNRIHEHLASSSEWTEDMPNSGSDGPYLRFKHRNGFHVLFEAHTEPSNLREVIMVYSPCVKLPHDFPRAGGPKY